MSGLVTIRSMFTLFFYTIAFLIEAFCVAFYKSRNACGVKLGRIFSKECIHSRLHLSISLEAYSSQVAFEHRKCPKLTALGARSGEYGGSEKIVIQSAFPPVAPSCSEVWPVKNFLLHLHKIESSGKWFATYVLQMRRILSAADPPLKHKNCTIMHNSDAPFSRCAFMLYWSSHPEICTIYIETQIFLFPILLLHNVAVLLTYITLGITFGTPFVFRSFFLGLKLKMNKKFKNQSSTGVWTWDLWFCSQMLID